VKHFFRVILLSFRYKWTILASVANALLIAVLWGASISTIYPLMEVVFEGETIHNWVDKAIADSQAQSDDLKQEIAELQDRQRKAPPEEQTRLRAKTVIREGRLQAEEKKWQFYQSLKPVVARWAPQTPFGTLVVVMAGLIAATILKGVCLVLNIVLVSRVAGATTRDLRRIFFCALLKLDQQEVEKTGNSRVITMFAQNMQLVQGGLQALYGSSIREPLKALACLSVAACISWRLLLVSLAVAPFGALLIYYLGRRMKNATGKQIRGYAAILQTLTETLGGFRVVKIFTRERSMRCRFKRNAGGLYKMVLRIAFYDSLQRPITELVGIVTIAVAILCGAYLVLNQQTHLFGLRMSTQPLSPSEMITFFAMLAGVSDPARKLSGIYNVIVRGAMASQGLYTFFERPPKVASPAHPVSAPQHSKSIRFEDVTFAYVPATPVVQNVNLEIPYGQTVAVIGPNGSGKSTLAHMIARFYDPVAGNVYIDDVNLKDIRPRQLRRQIGIVTQEPILFRDTVWQNIQYGDLSATPDQLKEAARLAGVTSFLDELPGGFATDVGDRGCLLSGGQRQRVALARAILSDPRILILDEPTSQVDPQTEAIFHEAISAFLSQRTTILITHRVATLALADRLIVMKDGRIVEDVQVSPSTSSPEEYSRLLARAG
jgi:ATP-binding cassette subfamily B protein/subfamily B ATP-binding cassette protein MsbA